MVRDIYVIVIDDFFRVNWFRDYLCLMMEVGFGYLKISLYGCCWCWQIGNVFLWRGCLWSFVGRFGMGCLGKCRVRVIFLLIMVCMVYGLRLGLRSDGFFSSLLGLGFVCLMMMRGCSRKVISIRFFWIDLLLTFFSIVIRYFLIFLRLRER